MIGRIRGQLVERQTDQVIVDVGGVGYRLSVPGSLAEQLELELEQEVVLQVHTQVRQDAIQLYGFATRGELACFELLLGVGSVGAKLALAVLSTLSVQELADAVAREDLRTLQRTPGVGKRVASRIVIDLAGKLLPEFIPVGLPATPSGAAPQDADPLPLALAQLGYRRSEIHKAQAWLRAQGQSEAPLGERVRMSLKHLSGG